MLERLQFQLKQLEAGIFIMGELLNVEDFKDYCDNAYTCINYIKEEIKKLKKEENG